MPEVCCSKSMLSYRWLHMLQVRLILDSSFTGLNRTHDFLFIVRFWIRLICIFWWKDCPSIFNPILRHFFLTEYVIDFRYYSFVWMPHGIVSGIISFLDIHIDCIGTHQLIFIMFVPPFLFLELCHSGQRRFVTGSWRQVGVESVSSSQSVNSSQVKYSIEFCLLVSIWNFPGIITSMG